MKSSFRVLPNDARDAVGRYDREDVRLVLTRAARDPFIVQELRSALARSSPGMRTSRLEDREVISQIEALVVRGDVVLAPAPVVNPAPAPLNTYTGGRFDDPVKFSDGKWVAVWPITPTPSPGELGMVAPGLDRNVASTEVTTVFDGPRVSQEMITTLNEMEDKKKETAKAQEKREKELAEAQKERDEAKKKVDAAKTEDERREAAAVLENAEAKIKMHTEMIKNHKNFIKELEEKIPRAVQTLRLHEQTHVDVYAEVAEHANELLRGEADPIRRDAIIDGAIAIAGDITGDMDNLLNPGTFGSEEDEKKLNDWISETSPYNYHSSIEQRIAALP